MLAFQQKKGPAALIDDQDLRFYAGAWLSHAAGHPTSPRRTLTTLSHQLHAPLSHHRTPWPHTPSGDAVYGKMTMAAHPHRHLTACSAFGWREALRAFPNSNPRHPNLRAPSVPRFTLPSSPRALRHRTREHADPARAIHASPVGADSAFLVPSVPSTGSDHLLSRAPSIAKPPRGRARSSCE